MRRNSDRFGPVLKILQKRYSVIQRSAYKQWSKEAQDKHLLRLLSACEEAVAHISNDLGIAFTGSVVEHRRTGVRYLVTGEETGIDGEAPLYVLQPVEDPIAPQRMVRQADFSDRYEVVA